MLDDTNCTLLHPNVLHFVARWVFKFWSNLLRYVLIANEKSSKGRQQQVQKFEVPSLGDILQVIGARQRYTSVITVRPSQGRDFIIVLLGDPIEETGQWVPWYESLMPIKNKMNTVEMSRFPRKVVHMFLFLHSACVPHESISSSWLGCPVGTGRCAQAKIRRPTDD